MITKEYFRGNKISKGLGVTKEGLKNIVEECPYVSVSEADKSFIADFDDIETVGVIMGDIDNVLVDIAGEGIEPTNETVANPDCWFVNKGFISKNYKELNNEIRFTFGEAIELLKLGYKVAREGWNGNKLPPKISSYPKYTPTDRVEVKGDYIYILLSNGDVAVTDATEENIIKLNKQKKWSVLKGGYPYYTDYSNNKRKTVKLHQYLYDCPDGLIIDHINGDVLDNRAENIRFVTHQLNNVNRKQKSGNYKGVSFDKSRNKWIASIQINGKTKHIGRFDSEEDAAKAYDDKAYELFGEYVRLNFPNRKLKPRMWLVYVPGSEVEVREGTPYWNAGLRGKIKIDGHIDMYTAQGTMQPGWLASQADIQAEDWVIVR